MLLTKILTQLARPLTLVLLLNLLAGLLFLLRCRRLGGLCLILAIALLWTFSVPVVSDPLRASLEQQYRPMPMAEIPQADAIVVLGGALGPALPPRCQADLSAAADRVLHAARLYRAGKARVVVAVGGRLPWVEADRSESQEMAALLREWGVPETAILREEKSRNTLENARFSQPLLESHGLEEVLLVTSALHMPRALRIFQAVGIKAIPAPTDFEVVEGGKGPVLRWLPDAKVLEGSSRAVKEWLGIKALSFPLREL